MEKLNEKIKSLFYYDKDKLVYVRHNCHMTQSTMYKEFMYILETQFGKFNEKDWDPQDYYTQDDLEDDTEGHICICTHPICGLYYITHKPTQMSFQVGSQCVKKCGEVLAEKMKLSIVKTRNFLRGNICIYCEDPLTDLRLKHQKKFFCNSRCYHKMKYTIPFGTHKSKVLVEFMCTLRGENWIKWINEIRANDKKAFYKHPLLLEIIDENSLIEE